MLPEIPSMGEFVPGYEASAWHGIGAPRNTPVELVELLNKQINMGLADSKMKTRIADLGYQAYATSPAEFAEFINKDTDKWAKIVKFRARSRTERPVVPQIPYCDLCLQTQRVHCKTPAPPTTLRHQRRPKLPSLHNYLSVADGQMITAVVHSRTAI